MVRQADNAPRLTRVRQVRSADREKRKNVMQESENKGIVVSQGRQRAYRVHGSLLGKDRQRISEPRNRETLEFFFWNLTYL